MKIRKWLALCLAVLWALPLAAYAQEGEEKVSTTLEGYVTEIVDGGFVLEDKQRGQVILNTDESTVWDGVLIDNELEAGMYVLVDFDGRMTRSIPPQAHADRVGCYTLQGVVSEFYESGVLVTGDEIFGDVIVNLELVDSAHVYVGMKVLVYYDGVMALSMPGRVTAHELVVPSLTGTVSEKKESSFVLTTEGGDSYLVLMDENTLTGMTLSATVEGVEELETEPEAGQTLEWGDGDGVTVYYSGDMQETTPPQVTAMEILVVR